MLLAIAAVIAGFIGLVWSADRFVAGAASTARNLGMPTILIGLTIVALGTSMPEILVSASAAFAHASDMAMGNAIGSNIANIGMVLGITALISPLPISRALLKRELPALLLATLVGAYCLHDLHLDRSDGIVLLVGMVAFFGVLLYQQSHHPDPGIEEIASEAEELSELSPRAAWGWLLAGLLVLLLSADILVWGAKTIATGLGVSQLVIGLTVIALGTSLPELAASVASALRGHHDIALGNIIGSNMLNLLCVLAVPALMRPVSFDISVLQRDYGTMAGMTLLLAVILYFDTWRKGHGGTAHAGRLAGTVLMLCYVAYYYVLAEGL